MIQPPVLAGSLDGNEVEWFLDNANHGAVTRLVAANDTRIVFGDVLANGAGGDFLA
jgi:hypothetical protein